MIGGATPAVQAGNGTTGSANIGTLTAGGANNTPGELVFNIGSSSQTGGSVIVEAKITDNGTAPVTFIKTGAGSMKLDGSNTYTGGSYILQGRVQLAGSEIGNANSGGFGTGPVFVFPGAYVFPSGASSTAPITNDFFLAGVGTNAEPIGAIRLGNGITMSGTIHLIGDARIGNGNATSMITGRITGGFNMDFGAASSVASEMTISNHANDWTGNTTIVGRTGGTAGNATIHLGADEVIPNGIGNGNLLMGLNGDTVSVETLDLNGHSETVNGVVTPGGSYGEQYVY